MNPTLDVMSFNLRFNNPADGEHAWPHRRPRVIELIRFYSPTVLGVQEALASQLDELDDALPGYAHVGVGRDDGKAAGEFAAILYDADRLDVIRSGTFWLSPTPDEPGSTGWGQGTPRIATWAVFSDRTTKQAFAVFNTHLHSRSDEARTGAAQILLQQVEQLVPVGMPVVLTGDFNTPPDSEPYRAVTGVFRDTRTLAGERALGPAGTFTGFVVRHVPQEAAARQQPIDYVFVSPGIDVVRQAHLSHHWEGRHASDHLPVLASLVLPRAEEPSP